MKKLSVILLVLLVSLFLIVSCGDSKGNETNTNQTDNTQTDNQTDAPIQTGDTAQVGSETETVAPETTVPVVPADKVETFKIDGVDLSKYIIFALDEIEEGEALVETISEMLDINVRTASGTTLPEDDGTRWIVLDRQSYAYQDWSMKVEDGNLHIRGSFRSFAKALEHFESYLTGERGADVNITSAHNIEGKIDKVTPLYSTKEELLAIYQYAMDTNNTIYGEHLGGPYSIATLEEAIRERAGDGPSILDVDMIGFYLGNYTRSMISQIVCEALEFSAKGGIITTFCHWQNPNEKTRNTIYRGSIGSKELWTSVLTDGTEFNLKWKEQLDYNAEVYQAWKDAGLPVTFRPMLEANTPSFWWAALNSGCILTGDDLRDMWNYVYDYYVNDLGLDNMLWTYSPNAVKGGGPADTTFYYPGDDKCDLVGIDWYIDQSMSRNLADGYGYQEVLAYGKPTGLCEWGVTGNLSDTYHPGGVAKSFSCQELVDIIYLAKESGMTVAFLETYSTYFGSAAWLPKAEALNSADGVILLDDMPAFIAKALGK